MSRKTFHRFGLFKEGIVPEPLFICMHQGALKNGNVALVVKSILESVFLNELQLYVNRFDVVSERRAPANCFIYYEEKRRKSM